MAVCLLCLACATAPLGAQTPRRIPSTELTIQGELADLPDAPMMQATAQPNASGAQSSSSAPQIPPASSSAPQQDAPPAGQSNANPPASSDAKTQRQQANQDVKAEEKQRLLGIMPQFQLVQGGQAVPLTGGQKWNLALHSAIDPFYIGWAFVIGGGWGEIVDSNKGYGWGDKGYFERVGANYADNVDGALIGNALLPQILRQDPRYFRLGTGSIGRRFLHAALSTVVCKGDNGKSQPNVSNVLGNFIAGGISNLYYPQDERGAKLTIENGISVTLFGALGGQFLEFGPDINRLALHRKKKAAATLNPTGAPAAAPSASAPMPAPAAGPQ